MAKSLSDRVLATPSSYAKKHYLYVQEIGTLTSMEPHVSSRENISSYLFLTVQKGEGYLTYRGRKHYIQAGDCVYINCRNQYAHESSAEHPWTLMWVHFNGNGADDFYQAYQGQDRSSIFHPADTAPFTDSLTALFGLMQAKPSLMELSAHKYLTDIITLILRRTGRKGFRGLLCQRSRLRFGSIWRSIIWRKFLWRSFLLFFISVSIIFPESIKKHTELLLGVI